MKFWQLLSIFRDEEEILLEVFRKDEWQEYYKYYKNIENVIRAQERDILDAPIENQLLEEVCIKSIKKIYWSPAEYKIYTYKADSAMSEISIINAIKLFKHDSIEEAFEKSQSSV